MGADTLKLQVVLSALDKAAGPLKRIQGGAIGAGRELKAARDRLKELNAQQKDISAWRTQRAAAVETEAALAAARQKVKDLGQEMAATGVPTKQMTRNLKAAIREATTLKQKHADNQVQLQGMRNKLAAAGISTRNLGDAERDLRSKIASTNQEMGRQEDRLRRITAQQNRLAKAKRSYERAQGVAGGMAASGAAALGSGYALSRPLKAAVDAFAPAENAATQLKVSMMGSDGSLSADFEKITKLATELGDRLPGTTADFQEMMTMLRRQGLTSSTILAGTGEAAAYLGVQLQKPVADAAEFAAKMQDATRTTEQDMLGLMDTIQRAYYLGVDDNNMLQGFTKLSPVMGIIKKQGLAAANTLAPLLVMMDQTGMAGESAGNAIRKVFQSGMDAKRFGKANAALADLKAGFTLDFTNGKGEFGGLDKLFAQLEKLKKLTSVQRTTVMKELFGDDAETLQVVNTLMDKGLAGYQEVAGKMQAQADLRTRVNEQLGTLANVTEAAEGSWTNAMAEVGKVMAPELKELIKSLGELANRIGGWVKANPELTRQIAKTVAGIALLMVGMGTLSVGLASLIGPFAVVRYGMMLMSIKGGGLVSVLWNLGRTVLPMVGQAILWIGRALMMNPIGLAITAIALAALLIYKYWDPIKAYVMSLWAEIKAGFDGGLVGILGLIANFSPIGMFYRAFAAVMNYFGFEMPGKFTEFGAMLMQGMVTGITNGLAAVKEAITGAGDSTINWFKEKLGIHSPSRVFASLGGFTMAGLVQGLAGGEGDVLGQISNTARRLTEAGAGMLGTGGGLSIDTRAPIQASGGGIVVQGDTVTFNIQATPGTDVAGLRQMLNQLLDERERSKAARVRSRLGDRE